MIKGFLWRWGPVLVWCGLIFYLSSVPHLAVSQGMSDFILRKTAHVLEYTILFILSYRAMATDFRFWQWSRVGLAFAFSLAYAMSDEWHQTFVTGRNGNPFDVSVDVLGLLFGVMIIAWWSWWNRSLLEAAGVASEGAKAGESILVDREQLRTFANQTAAKLVGGDVVALRGDLGAGKTAFTQDLAAALGVTEPVSSPTYGLRKSYALPDGQTLHHFDWYRLNDQQEVIDLGVQELWLNSDGITVIEWPERAASLLPPHTKHIHLEHVDQYTRRLTITS